jgi:hypothetical protein|eukprot:g3471.t1 g3471   contig12:2139214-2140556(+)
MAVLKKVGTVVLGVAILIGAIGKFQPHLFMNLPFPLSIILWVTSGGSMPPYFTQDAWAEDEIDTWTKDGDVVVATGAKSGTTFMLYCTHQIRTKGTDTNDELFPDVSISTPWPDLIHSRGGTWAEQKDRYNTTVLADGRKMKDLWDNPAYPFRIFKSHFAPPELPVRKTDGKKIKYIAMARNGLDFASSMTTFYSSHSEKFRQLWGGFPPDVSEVVAEGENHPVMNDILPTGPLAEFYWGYIQKWWKYKDDPNVLLLHYADVRKDLKGNVAKVAEFVGVELNEEELDVVTERCGIDHMKRVNRFNYLMPLNKDTGRWDAKHDFILKDGKLIQTGQVGKGASAFTEEAVAKWKKAEEEQFGYDPAMLKWAREGGAFP